MEKAVDLYVLYRIIKDISTPFRDTNAFKLGLIDADGKKLKSASTPEEKKAMGYYTRFVFNIKRALSRIGLDSKVGTYAGAIYLMKEVHTGKLPSEEQLIEGLKEEALYLSENTMKSFGEFFHEDAPANAAGPAIAGINPDDTPGKKKGRPHIRGRAIDGVAFLRRMNKQRVANNVVS